MRHKDILFFIISFLAGAIPAAAQKVLSLEQCVDSAFANNPSLKAASLEVEKSRIMKGTAFNPPQTEVTLKQETTGGGGPENGVYFGQEFDFPTLYVARGRSLSARHRLEAGRLGLLQAEVEREVSLAFHSLLYYRHLLDLNSRLGKLYEEFCRVAEVRLKEGETSALEVMNAQRVLEKNTLDRRDLLLDYDLGQLELQRLTGISGEITPADSLFQPLPLPATSFDFDASTRGNLASREIEVAEKEINVARQELLPGIRLGATVQALIKSFNPYHIERLPFEKGNFMGFEVGITVPLFFGAQSARIKAADADRRISLLNRETAEAQARSEYDSLASKAEAAASRLDYYRDSALPRADEISRLAQVSYSLGEIDYMEYISNMETAFAIYREYAGCIHEFNQSIIKLNTFQ